VPRGFYTMYSRKLLTGLCISLLAGLASTSKAAVITRLFGTISISGEIKPGDFDALKEKLDARPDADIVIRSPGGNAEEAIRMAELIHARQVALKVSGYCASACANYIFVSARERAILNGGFVAFHAGVEGWLSAALPELNEYKPTNPAEEAIYRTNINKMQEDFLRLVRRGQALHLAKGVSPTLHDAVMSLTAPAKARVVIDEASRNINVVIETPSPCDEWVPDSAALSEVGLQVRMADSITNRDAVAKSLNEPKERIYFGRLSAMNKDDAKEISCASALVPSDGHKKGNGETANK
jgi:ATP-dependent protease ClpP protease subunit